MDLTAFVKVFGYAAEPMAAGWSRKGGRKQCCRQDSLSTAKKVP
jgi:hypothetical protein